jgi:hypothetical protein
MPVGTAGIFSTPAFYDFSATARPGIAYCRTLLDIIILSTSIPFICRDTLFANKVWFWFSDGHTKKTICIRELLRLCENWMRVTSSRNKRRKATRMRSWQKLMSAPLS